MVVSEAMVDSQNVWLFLRLCCFLRHHVSKIVCFFLRLNFFLLFSTCFISCCRQPNMEMSGQQKSTLETSVRQQKERNMLLSRLNGELNQELQEVMEQRIALEIQLDHLRPFSS